MLTIVLDTNVFISALLSDGNPRQVFESVIEGKTKLAVSDEILVEITEVLNRKKFGFPKDFIHTVIREIESIADSFEPSVSISIITKDPDDNKFIECAVEANADFIVSGDKDLLNLKSYQHIPVISPYEFLRMSQTKQIRK